MNRQTRLFCTRYLFLLLGLLVGALGTVFIVKASLGVNSWNVFHLGIAKNTQLTIGQVMQLTGLVIIVLSYFLGIRPQLGTLSNMVFLGYFTDLIKKMDLIPDQAQIWLRVVYLMAGILIFGTGTGMYISARLGAGPRDSLMLGMHQRLGWQVSTARTILELGVLVAGYLLGGPVGVGTLVYAVAIGPVVQWALSFFGKRSDRYAVTYLAAGQSAKMS